MMILLRTAILAASIALLALAQGDALRSFDGGSAWINSPPISAPDLRGKVVLVDFWEYTCINCLRALPYMREWYKRYHDFGLTIVGVHTPEFAFSANRDNIAHAAQRLGVSWPVVIDEKYAIWKRYGVDEWPTELLFDQNGRLEETVLGEGGYQQTESTIQKLLRTTNPHASFARVMALLPQDSYDKPGAVCYPKTDEVVVARTRIDGAPAFGDPSQDVGYRDSAKHADGGVYLNGFWHKTQQAVVSGSGDGYLSLPYHAIQVEAVMTADNGPVRVNVAQDGKPVARADAGPDIHYDAGGNSFVTVDAPRAYDVIMNAKFGNHDLRLYPQKYGVAMYDFAFESCEIPGQK